MVAIVALPVVQNLASTVVPALAKKVPAFLGLKSSKCQSLTWSEVPDGPLHVCEDSCGFQVSLRESIPQTNDAAACWGTVVGRSLNVGWKRCGTVQKPGSLSPWHGTYLRTDMKTIMAFVIRSNGGKCWRLENCSFPWEEAIRTGTFDIRLNNLVIEFKKADHDVRTAHISGGSPGCPPRREPGTRPLVHSASTMLTKDEMDCILDGYPPVYRKEMRSKTDERPLQNPLRSLRDTQRAGWVAATVLAGLEFVGFYVDDRGHMAGGFPPAMGKALERVHSILTDDIEPHFPEDADVKAAITTVRHMIDIHTGSDAYRYMTATLSKHPSIGADVSNRVIRLFNRYGSLDESELELVQQNLAAVLQTAVWGVFEVVEYFKDTAVWIPRTLMIQEIVYLRDCGGQH